MIKRLAALLILALLALSFAAAEEASGPILPLAAPVAAWDGSSVPDGRYCIGIEDAGHLEDGYLDLSLWTEELYDRQRIESMKTGDRVTVAGETYTAAVMLMHGYTDTDGDGEPDLSCVLVRDLESCQPLLDSRELVVDGDLADAPVSFVLSACELVMQEDFGGYIVFEPVSETACRAVINDWSPCRYLGSAAVALPLPEGFVFLDYADNEGDAQTFLDGLSEARYSPYNTYAWFENGLLVKVSHSDYPAGPDQ